MQYKIKIDDKEVTIISGSSAQDATYGFQCMSDPEYGGSAGRFTEVTAPFHHKPKAFLKEGTIPNKILKGIKHKFVNDPIDSIARYLSNHFWIIAR